MEPKVNPYMLPEHETIGSPKKRFRWWIIPQVILQFFGYTFLLGAIGGIFFPWMNWVYGRSMPLGFHFLFGIAIIGGGMWIVAALVLSRDRWRFALFLTTAGYLLNQCFVYLLIRNLKVF
jgi:hypothetical protein